MYDDYVGMNAYYESLHLTVYNGGWFALPVFYVVGMHGQCLLIFVFVTRFRSWFWLEVSGNYP